jgi:hypothetical protein
MYSRLAVSLLSAVVCACAAQHATESAVAPQIAPVEAVQATTLSAPVETGALPTAESRGPSRQALADPTAPARAPVEQPDTPPIADAAIIEQIIGESRAGYPGPCPCPYDRNRAGRKCGGSSAYSKPGGYSPICFASQVTPAMIERRRSAAR